jgi:hypothetical protein
VLKAAQINARHVGAIKPGGVCVDKEDAKQLALGMAVLCVRNTSLESLHAGTLPSTNVPGYSDVKLVSPYGEIPWNHLSRISDDEMRLLMKEVVNKIYSVLLRMDDPEFIERLNRVGKRMACNWDEPKDILRLPS